MTFPSEITLVFEICSSPTLHFLFVYFTISFPFNPLKMGKPDLTWATFRDLSFKKKKKVRQMSSSARYQCGIISQLIYFSFSTEIL